MERGKLNVDAALLTPVTLRIAGDCPGYAHSAVRVRGHAVTIDEPPERDGTDLGPAPTELFVAALIGVTNVIVRRLARRDGIAVHALSVSAAATLDRRGVWLDTPVTKPWPDIRLDISIATDAEDARIVLWLEDLDAFSPLHTLLREAGTPVRMEWCRC